MLSKDLFITLEGVEGAGKTTLAGFICEILSGSGHEIISTREPGGTNTGEQIRTILLDRNNSKLTDNTELMLIFAARIQHLEEVIRPALNNNKTVVCDRFTDASYAYQGGGRGIDLPRIQSLEKWVQQDLKPDLTFLFDLDVETGLRRAGNRGEIDRFEQEEISFFQRIRDHYLQRAHAETGRFRIIDATKPLEEVKQQVLTMLKAEQLC